MQLAVLSFIFTTSVSCSHCYQCSTQFHFQYHMSMKVIIKGVLSYFECQYLSIIQSEYGFWSSMFYQVSYANKSNSNQRCIQFYCQYLCPLSAARWSGVSPLASVQLMFTGFKASKLQKQQQNLFKQSFISDTVIHVTGLFYTFMCMCVCVY